MSETTLSTKELIERFASIQKMSFEEAEATIGGETVDVILNNIKHYTVAKIREKNTPQNRKQRRAMAKKFGVGADKWELAAEYAVKLNYIDLIQKMRELNEKKENEVNEDATENN